jgi:membrane-associated phospholipid phosphatase
MNHPGGGHPPDSPEGPSRRTRLSRSLVLSGRLGLLCAVAASLSYFFVDRPLALHFRDENGSPLYLAADQFERLGEAQWYVAPAIVVALVSLAARTRHWRGAAYLACAVLASGVLVNLLKRALGRNRPLKFFGDDAYGFHFFEPRAIMHSFPSGHTTTAFSAAVALGLLFPRYRVFLWCVAGAVGMSRVVTTGHFLSDIFAGAWLGTASALVLAAYLLPGREAYANSRNGAAS